MQEPTSPSSPLRRLVRWSSLAAFIAIALAWPPGLGHVLPALSPHVAAGAALARRALGLGALLSVPVLVLVALRRRWFCRWLCPTGRVLELCGRARPGARGRAWARLPFVGQWLAAATLAGAALALPLFLWADPLALFAAALRALRQPTDAAAAASAALLLLLATASALLPGLWCARLCPLGGVQEALAQIAHLGWPRRSSDQVILSEAKDLSQGQTRLAPPRPVASATSPNSPSFRPRDETGEEPQPAGLRLPSRDLPRRAALGAACGAIGALGLRRLLAGAPKPLRPPGAADEATLRGLCLRCGNCARVCPSRIVHQDLRLTDPTGLLAPVIRFDGDYCREDCRACGLSCPSGAIARLPLAAKNRRAIGLARIDFPACLLPQEKECGHCIPACPYAAIQESFSDATWTPSLRIDPARCNGCGACLRFCPPRAITIHAR